ncbi:MAG: flagellar biosynthesis protein FlhB [Gaiellales bacterium]|nr:flagellar biosynthesis protein FlhB [Gaiellales bacterium]
MSGDNKTEKATPKRREEARKKGQVVKSSDVGTAVVLAACVGVLMVTGSRLLSGYSDVLRHGLTQTANPNLVSRGGIGDLAMWAMRSIALLAAPVALAALVGGVLASVVQVRPRLTLTTIKPQWSRVDPRQGIKKIFGINAVFETMKASVKTSVVGGAAFMAVYPKMNELAAMTGIPPGAMLVELAGLVVRIAIYVCLAFALVAAADYGYQRHRHEKQLRMSKDEIKQEARQSDLAPEVRGAIRRRQFQQARKRMIADVATADVVITNPTHFAIALRYDGTRPAPELVAKGVDLVAAAIREEAARHDITVLSNPPLARALYREVEVGQMIPDSFFQAVAEVLAFVYRTAGRTRRERAQRRPRGALSESA